MEMMGGFVGHWLVALHISFGAEEERTPFKFKMSGVFPFIELSAEHVVCLLMCFRLMKMSAKL